MQGRSVPGGFPSAPPPLCSSALWGAVLRFSLSPFPPFSLSGTGSGSEGFDVWFQHPASLEYRVTGPYPLHPLSQEASLIISAISSWNASMMSPGLGTSPESTAIPRRT